MDSKDKTKFRATKKWKDFRKRLLKERGHFCEVCGVEKRGKATRYLQIHHLDSENYTDLNPKKFVILCSVCHNKTIERFLNRKDFDVDDYCNKLKTIYLKSRHGNI